MEPPTRYLCPIGMTLMSNPVMCPDGHNFDRPHIEAWLNKEKHCPLDRKALKKEQLYPNRALKEEIEEWERKEKEGRNNSGSHNGGHNIPRAATAPDLAPTVPAGVPRSQSESGAVFVPSHQGNYASAPPITPSVERDLAAPPQYGQYQQPPGPPHGGSYYQSQPHYSQQQGQQDNYNGYSHPSNDYYGYGSPQQQQQYGSYQGYQHQQQPPYQQQYQHQQGSYGAPPQHYQHQHQHQNQPPNYNPHYQHQPPPQASYGAQAGGAWQSGGGNHYAPPQGWGQQQQQQQQYGGHYAPVVPVPQTNVDMYKDQPWRRYGMKQDEYDNIVATFTMVDQDDSGQLDRNEVRSMCEMLGYPSNNAAVDQMFRTVDRDNSGTIDLHEFVTYMIDHRPRPEIEFGMTDIAYRQLKMQFHEFDRNGDQALNKQELQQLCKNMGYPSGPEVIDRMFQAMDTDRNGTLSFHEFLVWMKDNQPRQLAQTQARR